jgi:hypothetical protein
MEFIRDQLSSASRSEPTAQPTAGIDVTDTTLRVESAAARQPHVTYKDPKIVSGDPFTVKKSTFQAHVAAVTSAEDVRQVLQELKNNSKVAKATHNIFAFRIFDSTRNCWLADCDDDGETQAGSRLALLLDVQNVVNAMVVVTRWYVSICVFGYIHVAWS